MNCVVNRFECSRYTNSQQHGCADFGVTTFRLTIVKKETALQMLEMLLLMSSIIHNYLLEDLDRAKGHLCQQPMETRNILMNRSRSNVCLPRDFHSKV